MEHEIELNCNGLSVISIYAQVLGIRVQVKFAGSRGPR